MADHYQVLEVSRTATAEEIKRAYRRLARTHHPDANPGDPAAEARFKEIAVAYEVLSDPARRQRYDLYGDDGAAGASNGQPFGGGLGDIFDMFFNGGSPFGGTAPSGPPRGSDLEVVVELEFVEAVFGVEKSVEVRTAVTCEPCGGSGSESGSLPITCADCGGTGQIRRLRQSILGQMVTAGPCSTCSGFGTVLEHACVQCAGEGRRIEAITLAVEIPAGVDSGAVLRLRGRGAVGPRNGLPGDLDVHVRVRAHDRFLRYGDDLVHRLHIPMTQAALGAQIDLETLDGEEKVPIAPGTQTGAQIRLRGLGVPRLQGRGRGDLLLEVVVDTPEPLDEEQSALLARFAALRGETIDPPDQGLLGRFRSAFR